MAPQKQTSLPDVLIDLFPMDLIRELASTVQFDCLEEIRLRKGSNSSVIVHGNNQFLKTVLSQAQIDKIFLSVCDRSLYAHREHICQGFIPLAGGIRVGICGTASVDKGQIIGVSSVSCLAFRIPHSIDVDVTPLVQALLKTSGGLLLFAPPGVGKTTCLRSLARSLSSVYRKRTVMIDQREEFAGTIHSDGMFLDILCGYPCTKGIEIAFRYLNPEIIVCDEIANEEEANALIAAVNVGIPVVASTHGSRFSDIVLRPGIKRLVDARAFSNYVGIQRSNQNRFSFTFAGENPLEY